MIHETEKTHLGIIKIHNDVIASIAILATGEVEGIAKICDNITSKCIDLVKNREKIGAIGIKTEKDGGISITIPVIVKFGYNIPDIALALQEKIKTAVEETTDIELKDIIIKIKGVEK